MGQDALHDVVEQCRFGRPPSRPVGTEKDVKYEERPVGCNPIKHHWLGTTMNNKSIPARRRVDRHTGPAESDNPEVQGLHSEATTVQSSKSSSSRLLA